MPTASSAPSRAHTLLSHPTTPAFALDRRRLRVQPRLVDPGAVERARDVDARRDVVAVDVQLHTAGQPSVSIRISERHASTHRSSNVDAARTGTSARSSGYAGVRSSHSSSSSRCRRARRSSPRTGSIGSMPASASAFGGRRHRLRARTCAGLSASSCSRPSIGAHVHTSASKIGFVPVCIETRIDSARFGSAQRRDLDDRRRRTSRRRGSGRRC